MSERYGRCQDCRGTGSLFSYDELDKETQVECNTCGGTGLSGNIEDRDE